MELDALIAECTAYDFKLMLEEKKPKSWLKSVSAFANGLGGSLFFGIDDDGVVRGLDNAQHVCEIISSKVRDYMDPQPEVEILPYVMSGGLCVLQLKVHACNYTPCYKENLCPVFKSTPTQFQTTIYAATPSQDVGVNVVEDLTTKLTERQSNILLLVRKTPTINARKISEIIAVNRRTIERDLATLQKMGILKREGADKNGRWIVTDTKSTE